MALDSGAYPGRKLEGQMASRSDWAFNVHEFVEEHFAEGIGFAPDDEQRYPDRITGTDSNGSRTVIIPRPVGSDNAARFRRWAHVGKVHWENMRSRPPGWRYLLLMVGLLPDGQPWWAALYDEADLAASRDFSENMGGFYRWDPGLTREALVGEWDRDKPEADVAPAVCPTCGQVIPA